MSTFVETLNQLEEKQSKAYSYIRMFLGLALFVRGIIMVSDPGAIVELASNEKLHMWFAFIAVAHLVGGLLMMFGLFTRFGALFQVPVLFGAVFVVHFKAGLMVGGQSLELSALVLFLLIIYLIYGSGTLSLDRYFANRRKAGQ
ncbi:MAG: DoxX family protein [Cyclobacteriaceae bacterium]|nr:DoxX family protein [Cyclobacteriaceae bacterium]